MVLAIEVITLFILVLTFVFLPFVLIITLFLLSRRYRGMFDQIGFSRKEISLLVFGSLSASLVSIDVPFVVFGNYLLAVNVSGAIIPAVLSIHLLKAKRIEPGAWILGILAVSLITFLITRVQPNAGIVAEFPWLFIPSASAALLALSLYSRKSPRAPAYAYATATMGSLIGADVYHMPELFAVPQFVGSIGGAGVYDLVYVAGVLSMALVLVVATGNLRTLRSQLPRSEAQRLEVSHETAEAVRALVEGRHQASVQRSLVSVQMRLRAAPEEGVVPPAPEAGPILRDPTSQRAYDLLVEYAGRTDATEETAHWALFQAEHIQRTLDDERRRQYASIPRRASAFAVDALFMVGILGVVAYVLATAGTGLANPLVLFVALFFWAWSIQMIYFTLFEYFWAGQTPGKWLAGVRVVDLSGRPPDFITAFARNVVRILDFALLFYLVSVLTMNASRRLQRLGDMAAETVVVRRATAKAVPNPI